MDPIGLVFEHVALLFGEVVEPERDGALPEEACHLGQALKVYNLAPLPVCSVCFVLKVEDVIIQLLALAICCQASPIILVFHSGTIY